MNKKKCIEKSEIRKKVVHAASLAFMHYGVKQVRMDDIASDLSISKRTIYELFTDKEELLLEVVKAHNEEVREYIKMVEKRSDNVLEIILAFYEKGVQDMKKINASFLQDIEKYDKVMVYLEQNRKENIQLFMHFYEIGVEQGLFREDCNYPIVQRSLVHLRDFIFHENLAGHNTLSNLYETILSVYMRGVSTEKGMKIVDAYLEERKACGKQNLSVRIVTVK